MKDYQKPEVEMISLIAAENILDDLGDEGEMGTASNLFDF